MVTLPSSLPEVSFNEKKYYYSKTSPIDGSDIGDFFGADEVCVNKICETAHYEFLRWKSVPLPQKQEMLLRIYDIFKTHKDSIADLIQLEVGKIRTEALGEVQEALDMILFCVGLCRTLEGKIYPSERPHHFIFESWQPIGVCGVITAFNFPVAVWAWNFFLAVTCGNSVVWKPSELTPKTAIYVATLTRDALQSFGFQNLCCVILGGPETGQALVDSEHVKLISATGSVEMGRSVSLKSASTFKKLILELGGNNAVIVHKDANLDIALKACYFGIVGTAGQRCTSIRRLIVHTEIYDDFLQKLSDKLKKVVIGDPREKETNMGPLISELAAHKFENAMREIFKNNAKLICGGNRLEKFSVKTYVEPTLVSVENYFSLIDNETFAPLAYCFRYSELEEAVHLNNRVPQGLSSAVFTENMRTAMFFLQNSDCGLANVNTSTSGAEIGLAFGGEKLTGGGREAGSDCWKYYMRRQSCVINWSGLLPLAQNVEF
ncbi:MAG: aldehyde dehydrogenase family protein [Deltaproteobacteria bacterium]|nr:aldehyde dehydrogenase family protein [Deltaproteobacteria bacterium]